MIDPSIMAHLCAQEKEIGGDMLTLKALVEEAAQAGAHRAMQVIGLADDAARKDLDELRQLLAAWRDAKVSARRAFVEWMVRVMLALLLIGLAIRFRLTDLVRG